MSKSETKTHKWRKEFSHPTNTHSSLAKQSKNAMMSSISPSEDQTGSKAKFRLKSLYDERMASLQTDGLSSGDNTTGCELHAVPEKRHEQEGVVHFADQANV